MITKQRLTGLFLTSVLAVAALAAEPYLTVRPEPPVPPNPTLVRERRRVMNAQPLAMYYYDDTRGLPSVEKSAAQITVLCPQCFTVDTDGIVRGAVPPPLSELARRFDLPLMPLLVNPGFDRRVASELLRDPQKQERAASYLAYLANRDHYVGWQLDLENIDPADKSLYTTFAQHVAAKLHRDGRLLSVAVIPRFSDRYPDTRQAEFRTGEWGAPYDFRALGEIVDFMVLLTYDQHNSGTAPGPVAGHDWVRAALDFAERCVWRRKLLMGIPLYGREWVETAHGVMSRPLAASDLRPLLERPDVQRQWDARGRTPWFQFRDEEELHTVWFDDRESYKEKLELVRARQLRGFAAWRLGMEDPEFWSTAAERPKAAAKHSARKTPQPTTGNRPRRAGSTSR